MPRHVPIEPRHGHEGSANAFEPYRGIKEPNAEARTVAQKILQPSTVKKRRATVYETNRLEVSAPLNHQGGAEIAYDWMPGNRNVVDHGFAVPPTSLLPRSVMLLEV